MSLRDEVSKFKEWASRYFEHSRSGEWECDYPNWSQLHAEALSIISFARNHSLTTEETGDLLYAIARDNEIEYLANCVAQDHQLLLMLSAASVSCTESDAKWQLAKHLGKITSNKLQAESILLCLVSDTDEYVSRISLLALSALGSDHAVPLARRAWETGLEYQRIAALWVFKERAPEQLAKYVEKAHEDGRCYVVANAQEVQNA